MFWRLFTVMALGLGLLALRGCERYTTEYQTLPVLDWLESRPPLYEAGRLPPAADLARGLARVRPYLAVTSDVAAFEPIFAPPGVAQRRASGVRDAATIQLGTADAAPNADQVALNLSVVVFNRAVRAAAWAELTGRELDVRDPVDLLRQFRLDGSDQPDTVWLAHPGEAPPRTGVATLVGRRGPLAYTLRATSQRPTAADPDDRLELAARAEAMVRQAAADWTAWVASQAS
jgi:hypothetical protein